MMPEPLIAIHNLFKHYQLGERVYQVLKNISLTIKQGELTAIVGASGSGKSTLLNILGLLDKGNSGQYLLNKHCISALNEDALADLRNQYFGFVFQQFNLLPRMTAHQNVALPLIYRQTPANDIDERVMSALSNVGMADYVDRYPTQLSGGQQQRVAIARALVGEPQVILADEPTGALDSHTGKEIMDIFLSLHTDGRTLLIITHDHQLANQCQRRIMMADGEIVEEVNA